MTLTPLRGARPPRPAPSTGVRARGWERDWAGQGQCAGQDPDALFVEGREQRVAKAVCQGCPVMAECLADALDNRTQFGVWGGMTERERRALLRSHQDVTNWTALLQSMRAGGEGPLAAIADLQQRLSARTN